jgi:maltooligosyltrehalose trehalohydrolase
VRRGRREEFERFGWDPDLVPDPQDPGTFETSVLRWDEREAGAHAEMLAWYRELIALRRTTPQLLDPRLSRVTCRFDDERGWFVMERGAIGLAFNLAREPQELELAGTLLLASEPGVTCTPGLLGLPPGSVAFVELAP